MKFSNTALFLLIVSGVVSLYLFLLFKPSLRDIKALQTRIRDGQIQAIQDEALSEELQEKQARVETLRDEVTGLKKMLLQPDENDPLVNELTQLTSSFDFREEYISSTREDTRNSFNVALVDVRFEGEFDDIYRFIQGLEDLRYAVQIERFDLRSISGESQLLANITLSAARDSL
jgi:Tfp pilus assembly protein PilO